MEIYVLTCINEDLDIVSQSCYSSEMQARYAMVAEYNRERSAMVDSGIEMFDDDISKYEAVLVYGEQPEEYKWHIRCMSV